MAASTGRDIQVKNELQNSTYSLSFLPSAHPGILPVSLFPVKYLNKRK